MRIEHYNLEKLKKEILEIMARHLELNGYKVFFFGSRVMNKGSERSDIDVGVEGKKPIGLSILSNIKDDIEKIPTLYKIDVVDFSDADEKFKQVAKEKIEFLN